MLSEKKLRVSGVGEVRMVDMFRSCIPEMDAVKSAISRGKSAQMQSRNPAQKSKQSGKTSQPPLSKLLKKYNPH